VAQSIGEGAEKGRTGWDEKSEQGYKAEPRGRDLSLASESVGEAY
jgi:hypothetical protein